MSQISVRVHRVRSAEQNQAGMKTSNKNKCMTTAGVQRHGAGRNSRGPPTLQERNILFCTRSTGQAKQRITSKTPNLRPEVGLCLPVVEGWEDDVKFKVLQWNEGETAQSFLFLLCAWGKVVKRVGHNLLEVTLQFIPLIFSVPVYCYLSIFSPDPRLQYPEGS